MSSKFCILYICRSLTQTVISLFVAVLPSYRNKSLWGKNTMRREKKLAFLFILAFYVGMDFISNKNL